MVGALDPVSAFIDGVLENENGVRNIVVCPIVIRPYFRFTPIAVVFVSVPPIPKRLALCGRSEGFSNQFRRVVVRNAYLSQIAANSVIAGDRFGELPVHVFKCFFQYRGTVSFCACGMIRVALLCIFVCQLGSQRPNSGHNQSDQEFHESSYGHGSLLPVRPRRRTNTFRLVCHHRRRGNIHMTECFRTAGVCFFND